MTTQAHYLPFTLDKKYGENTFALWAVDKPQFLIIFIHGFNGSTKTTWPNFPSLLPQSSKAGVCDIVFYGYDGLYTQSNNSAIKFYRFLDDFLREPAKLINETILYDTKKRSTSFKYERVIIVAHSLGAVITRQALLRAHSLHHSSGQTLPWLDMIEMIFFAPAHNGAYAASLAHSLLGKLGRTIPSIGGHALLYKMPLIQDLQPSSPVISLLKDNTIKAIKSLPATSRKGYLVARHVVWAELEKTVVNMDYCEDPTAELLDGKDHQGVCKPESSNDRIFTVVEGVI
jgi:hypothetical protein